MTYCMKCMHVGSHSLSANFCVLSNSRQQKSSTLVESALLISDFPLDASSLNAWQAGGISCLLFRLYNS